MVVKSPLRYPGGKSRALKHILPIIPQFDEYREPFVGGGSVFIALAQLAPEKLYWINDINRNVATFWSVCARDVGALSNAVRDIRDSSDDGRRLYSTLRTDAPDMSDFDRAVRFFVLNRITFSGTVDSGGYSEQAFENRFTESSIGRLHDVGDILTHAKITCADYHDVITARGDNVFIFMDPPYMSTSKSKLYGHGGDLHTCFDHARFADELSKCQHNWLATYDDTPLIRELFSFANIYTWELQYGMNNWKQSSARKGSELFISNYEIQS